MVTSGVLFVHSCPAALCPHVEWALAEVLGERVALQWTPQPAAAAALRTETAWQGPAGTAGRIVAALRRWPALRLEATEQASQDCDAERYALTPSLGIYRSAMSVNGDVLIHEDRLRALLARDLPRRELQAELDRLLGQPWDDELEPLRHAAQGVRLAGLAALTETG